MVPATSTRVFQTAKPAGLATPRRGALGDLGLPNQAQMDLPGWPAVNSAAWAAFGPSITLVATTPPAKATTAMAAAIAPGSGAAARRLSWPVRRARQDDADPSGSDPPPSDMTVLHVQETD